MNYGERVVALQWRFHAAVNNWYISHSIQYRARQRISFIMAI